MRIIVCLGWLVLVLVRRSLQVLGLEVGIVEDGAVLPVIVGARQEARAQQLQIACMCTPLECSSMLSSMPALACNLPALLPMHRERALSDSLAERDIKLKSDPMLNA